MVPLAGRADAKVGAGIILTGWAALSDYGHPTSLGDILPGFCARKIVSSDCKGRRPCECVQ